MGVTLQYSRIAGSVNLLPIRAVSFYDFDNAEGLHFFQIEAESSYKLLPITRPHYKGGNITVGFRAEANIYIANNPFNQYNADLIIRLEKLKGRYIHTQLILGLSEPNDTAWLYPPAEITGHLEYPLQDHLRTKVMNATDKMIVDFDTNLSFNYEIESVEYRPRLIIRLQGKIDSPLKINADLPVGFANRMFK